VWAARNGIFTAEDWAMAKRTISGQKLAWLRGEMAAWEAAGAIEAGQSRLILADYESEGEISDRRRSGMVFAIMAAAALLIGLGVLLLIGFNWQAITIVPKMAIIFGTIVAIYALGFHLRFVRGKATASEVVFLLGCLLYGAGIWLVAQAFNIGGHYPDGVWWWAVGVLPFTLCLDTLLLHGLLVALLAIWSCLQIVDPQTMSSFWLWQFGSERALLLPLLALPGIVQAWRKNRPVLYSLYAALLMWWVMLQPWAGVTVLNPNSQLPTVLVYGELGALFLIIAEAHRRGSRFAIPWRLGGCVVLGGILAFLSSQSRVRESFVIPHPLRFSILLLGVGIGVIAVALWRIERCTSDRGEDFGEALSRLAFPAATLAFLFSMYCARVLRIDNPAPGTNDSLALITAVGANLAMVIGALWLMWHGMREDRGRPFAAGVSFFLFWAFLRYVDLFGDFGGMIGVAMMFFFCGATLFGVAWHWRQRKGTLS